MILSSEVRVVIFDLDGVLWRSESAHALAYRQVLEPLGIAGFDYGAWAGRRTDEVFANLLVANGLKADRDRVAELTATKRDKAHRLLCDKPPLVNDCARVLQALARRYKLALASSASAKNVHLFLEASGTHGLFSVVLSGEDVAVAKPAPDIYLTALGHLGLEACEAIVVEDAVSGIRAARRAGIAVVALVGTCTREELAREDAFAIVESIGQLVDGNMSDC